MFYSIVFVVLNLLSNPVYANTVDKEQQLEILREEVAKGFEQLAAGEVSTHSVMDIFEQASLSVASKLESDNTNA